MLDCSASMLRIFCSVSLAELNLLSSSKRRESRSALLVSQPHKTRMAHIITIIFCILPPPLKNKIEHQEISGLLRETTLKQSSPQPSTILSQHLQSLCQPNFDNGLSAHPDATCFSIQRLHHPNRETHIDTFLPLPNPTGFGKVKGIQNILPRLKPLLKFICLHINLRPLLDAAHDLNTPTPKACEFVAPTLRFTTINLRAERS